MRINILHKGILLAISGFLLYVLTFFIDPLNSVFLAIKITGNTLFLFGFGVGLAGIVMLRSRSFSEYSLEKSICKKCGITLSSSARYCGSCGNTLSLER